MRHRYTAIGGLKATFMSSYIHTVYIYVVLCLFSITVYATSPDLGSPGKVPYFLTPYNTLLFLCYSQCQLLPCHMYTIFFGVVPMHIP